MKAARKGLRVITGKCGCFTAATLVMTAQGAVPIGEIEEGQQVLAAPDDGLSESYSSNTVGTKIVVGEANLVQLLVLHEDGSSEIISTTDEHPFHVADTVEWTRADGLVIGDRLSTISGTALLRGVLYTTERVPVYNLSIPGTPTYYVGEHGVWVHNAGCPVNLTVYKTHRAATAVTAGYNHYWEAHHLVPIWAVSHFPSLSKFRGKTMDMPSIILKGYNSTTDVHGYIQKEVDAILRVMPYEATIGQIRQALVTYYAGVPEAAAAVSNILK